MTPSDTPNPDLIAEIESLRGRLAEAEETLRAIRGGEVDALVVSGPEGDRVYTLKGEDRSYRVLVESVNEGALILTSDGTVMYANSRFARMIGVSLEKIIGASIDSFVANQDHEALKALIGEGVRYAARREIALTKAHTNELLPAYISISPMVLDEASALSAVVTDLTEAKRTQRELARHRDHLEDLVRERTAEVQTANEELRVEIEERRQIEEALRESEARLQATLRSSADEIWIVDAQARIALVSDTVTENLGIGSGELEDVFGAIKRLEILTPDGTPRPEEETPLLLSLRGETIRKVEEMIRNVATGELRWREVSSVPIRDYDGIIIGATAVARDITDRKRAEQALAESERYFRAVYDNSQDAILIIDDEGRFASANPAVQDLYGLPQDQLVGRDIGEFAAPDFDVRRAWEELRKTGAFCAEHKLIAADGTERIVETHATANMLPGRHLAVIHDVTGEVRLREQLTHQVALLQQALLPPAPKSIEGYAVASKYIPAFAGEQEIGGDFYDLFLTESGEIGLMIGDVSGKGIEAAALAAVTRSTVRAFAYDLSSPSAALNHANALLAAQQFNKSQFVTAFLALVDPATGVVRYASAGHPPAIVQCVGGAMGLLDTGSAPLGVLESPDYAEYTTRLDVGDRMVIYTDGISESRKGSILFGTEGIEQVLVEHGAEPPDVLAESILEAAKNFAEGKLRDDTALVIICRS